MSLRFQEYNDTISLKERDIPDILRKAKHGNCDYFMQLNLQGRHVWMGFKEPFESTIDMLYALYYKVKTSKGYVYMCLGLWRERPNAPTVYNTLMLANKSIDAVIDNRDISEFMSMGETQHLVLKHPAHQDIYDNELPSFVSL